MKRKSVLIICAVITFVLCCVAVVLVDGYIVFSIRGPQVINNRTVIEDDPDFTSVPVLLGYTDAEVIDHALDRSDGHVYILFRSGEETRLLYLAVHHITGRYKLYSDVLVTDATCNLTVSSPFFQTSVEITDYKITNLYSAGGSRYFALYGICFLSSLLITALETFLLSRFLKRRSKSAAA